MRPKFRGHPANVALCTLNQGYGGGRRARGGGVRSRGDRTVRLPLSPRTLCAPGSGSTSGAGTQAPNAATAQQQQQQQQPQQSTSSGPRDQNANSTTNSVSGGDDVAAPPDEPMLNNVERNEQSGAWVCCMPCLWLRQSKAVHKALLTFAMLLVTSLLVTSPVLFLITTLPEGDQTLECGLLVS